MTSPSTIAASASAVAPVLTGNGSSVISEPFRVLEQPGSRPVFACSVVEWVTPSTTVSAYLQLEATGGNWLEFSDIPAHTAAGMLTATITPPTSANLTGRGRVRWTLTSAAATPPSAKVALTAQGI